MKTNIQCTLLLLLILTHFACKPSNDSAKTTANVDSTESAPTINIKGSLSENKIEEIPATAFKESTYTSPRDWLDLYASTNSDPYFDNENNEIITYSKNKKYILVYNRVSSENTIYDASWQKLGSININANNPEFSIKTFPLEKEPGIILYDNINGFQKYEVAKHRSTKSFKVAFNPNESRTYNILSNQNILQTFKKCGNDKQASIKNYSLETGALIDSSFVDCNIWNIEYFHDKKLLIEHGKNFTKIYDPIKDVYFPTIPLRYNSSAIRFSKNKDVINGISIDKDTLFNFTLTENKTGGEKYTLNKGTVITQVLNGDNQTSGALSMQSSTPGTYNNETKTSDRSVILFHKSKIYKALLPDQTNERYFAHIDNNQLNVFNKKKSYILNLDLLE